MAGEQIAGGGTEVVRCGGWYFAPVARLAAGETFDPENTEVLL